MVRKKKTGKEIKLGIVSLCWGMARHLEDIAISLNSNWKTCEKYCNEMVKEGILEEIKVSNKVVGYKTKNFIKEVVFNAFSPRHLKSDLYQIPKEYPIKEKVEK